MTDDERKVRFRRYLYLKNYSLAGDCSSPSSEQDKLDYEVARRLYEEGAIGRSSSINFSILPGSPDAFQQGAFSPLSLCQKLSLAGVYSSPSSQAEQEKLDYEAVRRLYKEGHRRPQLQHQLQHSAWQPRRAPAAAVDAHGGGFQLRRA